MDQRKCYIFESRSERPAKRRCVERSNVQASWPARKETYSRLWARQEQRVQAVLHNANDATTEAVLGFASTAQLDENAQKIPAGLVLAGPGIASHKPFFQQLSHRVTASTASPFVLLSAAECPNLKTLLRVVIKRAISSQQDLDEDAPEPEPALKKGPRLLDYDLQLLYDWLKQHNSRQVVVAFQDSEAFEASLLAEALDLFSLWRGRINFVLLFGIATTVESFYDKLPWAISRCLGSQRFDVVQADEVLEQAFCSTIDGHDVALRIGPTLSAFLLARQRDHMQSVQAFVDALHYAYMSHFYTNPLSIFLREDLEYDALSAECFEALRNLPSFRRHAEELIDRGDVRLVRKLLDSNEYLYRHVMEHMLQGRAALSRMIIALRVLHAFCQSMNKNPVVTLSALYVQAVGGSLKGSAIVRELLLSIKKSSSDRLLDLLESWKTLSVGDWPTKLEDIHKDLMSLVYADGSASVTLRSEHDLRNETLRTTVVAHKVELSKQKSTLSKKDAAYSKILKRFVECVESYFEDSLIDPQQLFLNEILIYDLHWPQRAVFAPKPRYAIERALSSPHDYLDCNCCPASKDKDGHTQSALSGGQPATAIAYQLYLESGSLINVADLWSAFNAVVGYEDEHESRVTALFQRALAELKYLGLIKSSRKKADHITKLAWKGL